MLKVLFVGGYGRSGSTLLDRVLGQIPGFLSVGELRHVFQEGYLENRRCGCGERFHDCEFWRAVTTRAFGEFDGRELREVTALKRRIDRWWLIPQLGWRLGGPRRRRDVDRYREVLRSLYVAIAAESGAEVLIDSSKDVSHGYSLRGLGAPIDLYVLHLVRDSRAVAYSWQRRKFNPGNDRHMNRYGLLRTGAEWVAINALTGLHRHTGDHYSTLLYADFAADPAASVEDVLEFIGERGRPNPVSGDHTVHFGTDHTAAGNPDRFRRGGVTISPDDEWRRAMSPGARLLVGALTLPALSRYRSADRSSSRRKHGTSILER
ncbi:MAG TPA: sulfotransferase [Solirubrobacterales bacterium]|nr:sulfotransferase [Solirubrobacterales bacterium]